MSFFWAGIVLLLAHFQPVYSWVWIRQVPSPLSFPQSLETWDKRVLLWHIVYIMYAALRRPDVRKLLNLPDAVTSSSSGQPKPPSPIPFSFEQPKDQSVLGHDDPPMSSSEDPSMSSSESSSSVPERRISKSSVLNQRIRTLERQLKDQKKKKWETLFFHVQVVLLENWLRYYRRKGLKYPREFKVLNIEGNNQVIWISLWSIHLIYIQNSLLTSHVCVTRTACN